MSIITSFVNVIAGASVLLGGKAFMDEQIGTEGPTLRKAIGAPLLGIGALGIAISYVRNKRVREDKKAESDYYEAELYEADTPDPTNPQYIEQNVQNLPKEQYVEFCDYFGINSNDEKELSQFLQKNRNDSNVLMKLDILRLDAWYDSRYGSGSDAFYGSLFGADAETFCADKNCGCGQDPCITYGVESFEAMSTDKTFTGETSSGHKVEWDDGSFTMTFAEPIDGYESVNGDWYGGDNESPDEFSLELEESNYDWNDSNVDGCRIYIDNVEHYGIEPSQMRVSPAGAASPKMLATIEEGLNWMLGDYEEKTVVGRQYRAEEATPYGEEDMEYPVRIIVGGPPHSGKSTLMNLLEDKMNQYGVDVELRDLDFSSPTNLKAGFDPNRETKDWDEDLARDAASYFREDSDEKIVLGDSIGLISQINEIVSEPADVAILLVSGSKDQFDESFRNALAKWKSYYEFIDLPILMIIRSSMNPNEMNYFDPHDNYGVIVGLDRDAYKDGGLDNEISLENACLEGMVFEIAQEYDLELANRNTDTHIETITEKWPNIEGKPTWNPIDAGKPHLGKIEDDYFSTFDERRKAKAMSAEGMPRLGGQEVWVRVETQKIGNNEGRMDSEIAGRVTGYFTSEYAAHVDANKRLAQYEAIPQRFMNDLTKNKSKITVISYLKDGRQPTIVNKIEYIATDRHGAESFAVENDPDFDKVKADRNKDGEISDWEQSVGNAVAKGIREHGGKTPKATSMNDMERYMNVRWSKYTPRDKMQMQMMDMHYGHSNKVTKRQFKKGYEIGWNRAREDAGNGELLYMVARAKDLITTRPSKDGFLVDAGAYAGFEDSWRTYEGDEPIYMKRN